MLFNTAFNNVSVIAGVMVFNATFNNVSVIAGVRGYGV
jgi:hypothetical protein